MILVEGESDRAAVATLAGRLGLAPRVLAVGGSKGARGAAGTFPGERLIGLVDANERADFERVLPEVYVCDPDLEGELIRALGVDEVLAVIEEQGELASFHKLQQQPFQRSRTPEQQLARFFGGRSGNKARYARLLAAAVPLDRIPRPSPPCCARSPRWSSSRAAAYRNHTNAAREPSRPLVEPHHKRPLPL